MPDIHLYSSAVCPFAQRARILLHEKGLDYQTHEIDLKNKPDDFLQISPQGKVPVLICGDDRIWESTIINEYLEEVFPTPALMPSEPGLRALIRIWIDFANSRFTSAFYKLLLAQTPQDQADWREEMTHHLRFIEQRGLPELSEAGPYWLGDRFTLLDITYYPWFERWSALAHFRDMQIPEDCQRLTRWWEAMRERPAIQATSQAPEYHIEQYARYADNTATTASAQEMKRY
ncbi:MAG: glutathione S-transferase family protein [Leptolyngbya sp. SIOISBB]|nr:glutathione S-transferase family protein [Leptolyngbya sp. SIOISBB]